MDSEEPGEHFLVKNRYRNQNFGQKKIVPGGPKENEVRKSFRKAMREFGRVDFARAHLRNRSIGIPSAVMIPPVQLAEALLRGTIQNTFLHGSHQFLWILPTIRRTLSWILVAHDQLDRERQSEGS